MALSSEGGGGYGFRTVEITKFFERRSRISVYEALSLMIMFGLFILGLITLVLKLNDR
ncbi:putative holin-like toxin [Lacticaseibacillus paracasei]|uniref:putative holin-like toxin n=1 Tax=Lacticaseibacillus paracasei TaxID=1597 RepID=UPI0009B7A613|nr:putative holin-like toxin [Lacticaseibacillus paracasei]